MNNIPITTNSIALELGNNNQGSGLLLILNRGIPCEGNVQVFSAHSSVICYKLDRNIIEYIENNRLNIIKSFQYLIDCLDLLHGKDIENKEKFVNLFCCDLIKKIVKDLENCLYEKQLDEK